MFASHLQCISELHIHIASLDGNLAGHLSSQCANVVMPSLEALFLDFAGCDRVAIRGLGSVLPFSLVNVPNIQSLTVSDAIPAAGTFGDRLTTVKISLEGDDCDDDYQWPLDRVLDFIRPLADLQHLSLYAGNANCAEVARVELPNLASLSMGIQLAYPYDQMEVVMKKLVVPKLTSMDVELDCNYTHGVDLNNIFEVIFPKALSLRSLRRLNIGVPRNDDSYHSLHLPFSQMPGLQHLSVDAPYLPCALWETEDTYQSLPPLQSIIFKHCNSLVTEGIADLLFGLKKRGQWSELRRLEVVGCNGVRKDELEEFIPSNKLYWHE